MHLSHYETHIYLIIKYLYALVGYKRVLVYTFAMMV
jgi:hypothetical protein